MTRVDTQRREVTEIQSFSLDTQTRKLGTQNIRRLTTIVLETLLCMLRYELISRAKAGGNLMATT